MEETKNEVKKKKREHRISDTESDRGSGSLQFTHTLLISYLCVLKRFVEDTKAWQPPSIICSLGLLPQACHCHTEDQTELFMRRKPICKPL